MVPRHGAQRHQHPLDRGVVALSSKKKKILQKKENCDECPMINDLIMGFFVDICVNRGRDNNKFSFL